MINAVEHLWLIPALPLLAAGVTALLKQRHRTLAASLAIGSMVIAFFLACGAFAQTLGGHGEGHEPARQVFNIPWFQLGAGWLKIGWVLDPLTAAMLVMVTFVSTLIFIYSVGYMAHDENFTRFFTFLSLFAAAMLGLIIANNLLMLFMCWELVGLASYLLIGFWYHKPSAAAAAKKAFITTRVGDVFFFLGLLWLYAETGTLLFYDNGNGCLEAPTLAKSFLEPMRFLPLLGISLLIFVGAMGKSGQVPLHTWLPDAMEGPTPVSALIHAATMVAAGVFLVARVFPLMKPDWQAIVGPHAFFSLPPPNATGVITWIGAITAVFAALVAVAQTDIKRILAYSTVSQLGFMFVGLGTGGVAVGMFHLLTHAFFKALLFLGAGSVIHGCHEEQDIRRMGGLRKLMPVTFATYAIGMLALAGFPLVTSGFWSKDEILHSAWLWEPSKWPFVLATFGALLTAFYMTRQMFYVFFGNSRSAAVPSRSTHEQHSNSELHAMRGTSFPLPKGEGQGEGEHGSSISGTLGTSSAPVPLTPALSLGEREKHSPSSEQLPAHSTSQGAAAGASRAPHESPPVMTLPLGVLAACAILLSLLGTPIWPWFHAYLSGHEAHFSTIGLDVFLTMLLSVALFGTGVGLGWHFYGRKPITDADAPDALEQLKPDWFAVLRGKFFIDELYEISFIRWNAAFARFCGWLEQTIWTGAVSAVSLVVLGFSWLTRFFDEFVINLGFSGSCRGLAESGGWLARLQTGRVQSYLRVLGVAFVVLVLFLIWGGAK